MLTDQQAAPVPDGERGTVVTALLIDGDLGGVSSSELVDWSDRLVASTAPAAVSLAVRLTDRATMQRLNRQYRDIDRPTDVLSFPGELTPEGHHLGDIVIALPVASDQADAASHSLTTELKTLILHGVLHCLGHDHETDDGEMETLERRLRAVWVNDDD